MKSLFKRSASKPGWGALSGGERAFFVFKWTAISGLAFCAFSAAAIAIAFWIYGSDPALPRISSLSDYAPPEVSRVLTQDGEVIGEIYEQRRTYVSFDKLPPVLVNAFVAAEDNKFFQHKGIDYAGMVRALFVNIKSGEHRQGGSTITQQVVKNLLLTRDKTLKRKFQEIILARRLENHLTKQEILTLYANEIFFGDGRYGVQEAAQYYFGKDVSKINPGEAAMLAGLPQAPSRYSPKREENQAAAKQRQIYVLDQMRKNGFLTPEEAQKWANEPLRVIADPYPSLGSAPEWVELVRAELERRYGKEEVQKVGVDAVTTMDLKMQTAATEALRKGLEAYDQRRSYGRPVKTLKNDAAIKTELARLAKRLPKKGPAQATEYLAVVTSVSADGAMTVDLGNWEASIKLTSDKSRHNPAGKKPEERFKKGDVVKVMLPEVQAGEAAGARTAVLAPGPEGAVVILDPQTRHLLAIVGGYESRALGFNRATMAKRQAGSTFKPFVYAAALDSGDFTPATIVNDAPEVYDLWKPENYNKEFLGPVRLRQALAQSINTVAIRVANDISPARVAEVAHMMGIESTLPDTLSLALGSGEVTPLELTNAFATFAAGGKVAPPQVIKNILTDKSKDVPPPPSFKQAVRPEVAYVALDMMRSVITQGTGAKAASLHLDIAGKTGTSNDARDAWFVGLTPEYAVGVWIGFDDFRRPLGGSESGSHTALPVYIDIMKVIGRRTSRFVVAPNVVTALIDEKTGLLAAPGATTGVYTESFINGTVPVEVAPLPGEVDVQDFVTEEYTDPMVGSPDAGVDDEALDGVPPTEVEGMPAQ